GHRVYSPWQYRSGLDMEHSAHNKYTGRNRRDEGLLPIRWHSPSPPLWLSHMQQPLLHAPEYHSQSVCWLRLVSSVHNECTGPGSVLPQREKSEVKTAFLRHIL